MITAIFAENYKNAISYLENMVGEMKYKDVEYFVKSHSSSVKKAEVKLKNGDIYTVLPCSETIRGYKWNNAIVSRNVPLDFINQRIAGGIYLGEHGEYGDIMFFDEKELFILEDK